MDRYKTIRELATQIDVEIETVFDSPAVMEDPLLSGLNWRNKHVYLDLTMGVLARHDNERIVNDHDLPVTPLPYRDRRHKYESSDDLEAYFQDGKVREAFYELTNDLVSYGAHQPFIKMILEMPLGEWVDCEPECDRLGVAAALWERFHESLDKASYERDEDRVITANWVYYPGDRDYAVITFYFLPEILSNTVVYNRTVVL